MFLNSQLLAYSPQFFDHIPAQFKEPMFNSIKEQSLVKRVGQADDVSFFEVSHSFEGLKVTMAIDGGGVSLPYEVRIYHW
jgi:hypothetical protein